MVERSGDERFVEEVGIRQMKLSSSERFGESKSNFKSRKWERVEYGVLMLLNLAGSLEMQCVGRRLLHLLIVLHVTFGALQRGPHVG